MNLIYILFICLVSATDTVPIRGVNLGGVFLLEPFIRPSLFDQFLTTSNTSDIPVDEWTFCQTLGKQECQRQLQQHWDTFVTRQHLEDLVEGGINWIRIPLGYWAFNLTTEEPFVGGQIPYVERLLGWSRELGLKVELDLHGAPGSQNGYDNSGHRISPQWLLDRANVERTLDALAKMSRLAAEWPDVVRGVQALNEPSRWKWKVGDIMGFYQMAYRLVRSIVDEGVYFVVHDTFLGPSDWHQLVDKEWENSLVDTHIYQMFDNYVVGVNHSRHLELVGEMSRGVTQFADKERGKIGVVVGEFSAATHDCTKYINGMLKGSRWEGTLEGIANEPKCPHPVCSCTGDYGGNYRMFTREYQEFLAEYVLQQLEVYDGLGGWFYWNFRTEAAPEWDYLLGVQEGWVPRFDKTAVPLEEEITTPMESSAASNAIRLLFLLLLFLLI